LIDIRAMLHSVDMRAMFPVGALRPAGPDRFKTKCVFHNENTASMVVNLYRGIWTYRCFGCGEHGNAIDLVMHNLRIGLGDAIRVLADGREFLAGNEPAEPGTYELACDEAGCSRRVTIYAKDVDYVGYTRAVAWDHKDGKTRCPSCAKNRR
jgi:CHC2-type zinc finger protein